MALTKKDIKPPTDEQLDNLQRRYERSPQSVPAPGDVYGKLTVRAFAGFCKTDALGRRVWLCECVCGKEILEYGQRLRAGDRFSCGCVKRKPGPKGHGMKETPEYRAWDNAKQKCLSPNNPLYRLFGAKGIQFCERWADSFLAFYDDVGPKPSQRHVLALLDERKGYQPGNVVWKDRRKHQ